MIELFSSNTALVVFFAGIAGWIFSSLAAGGGALLSVPLLNAVLPLPLIAPVICTGSIIGSSHRAWLFRDHINWKILAWLLPGIISGALLGSWLFSRLSIDWLGYLVAGFLISSGLKHYLLADKVIFKAKLPHFTIMGFITALLSAVIGAVGPILNPLYLNYNCEKETILGTKAVSSALMQISKFCGYLWFLDNIEQWIVLGLLLGAGAIIGNKLGKKILTKISTQQFKHIANGLLIISGLLMI